jgi:hypothetical protein
VVQKKNEISNILEKYIAVFVNTIHRLFIWNVLKGLYYSYLYNNIFTYDMGWSSYDHNNYGAIEILASHFQSIINYLAFGILFPSMCSYIYNEPR